MIIDLDKEREAREPHLSGDARCLACKHEWQAAAPVGAVWLECPACSLTRGRFVHEVLRDGNHWHCGCGCDLFYARSDGLYCPNCGKWLHVF